MAKTEDVKNKTALAPTGTGQQAMSNWDESELESSGFTQEIVFKFNDVGEKCRGVYVGPGADIEMTEPDEDGNPVILKTWRVQNKGTTVRIIGTRELDSWFSQMAAGTEVAIVYRGEEQLMGGRRRVKRYSMYEKRDEKKIAAAAAAAAQGAAPAATNSGGSTATA